MIALLTLALPGLASAQQPSPSIAVVSTAEGLPTPFARALALTPTGLVVSLMAPAGVNAWLGAARISLSDPVTVTLMRGAASGLGGDHIAALRCGRDGCLWAATDKGLHRLSRGATRFERVGPPVALALLSIGDDGVVWAAGRDVLVRRGDTGLTTLRLSLNARRRARTLLAGAEGRAWLVCEDEVIEADAQRARPVELAGTPLENRRRERGERRSPRYWIFDAALDARGDLWLTSATRHLVRYHNRRFERVADGYFSKLAAGAGGVYVTAFDGTLRRWTGRSLDVIWRGSRADACGALMVDRRGEVWLEHETDGKVPSAMMRLAPDGRRIAAWTLKRAGSTALSPGVLAMEGDGDGGLWMSTNEGVWHLRP